MPGESYELTPEWVETRCSGAYSSTGWNPADRPHIGVGMAMAEEITGILESNDRRMLLAIAGRSGSTVARMIRRALFTIDALVERIEALEASKSR